MLRMSYSDHSLSVVCPSVHLSVNIFKWLLLWSRWANFAQISYGASLGWGTKDCWNGRGQLSKMAAMPIHLLLQNQGCLGGSIFAQIIVDERSTKFAKIMVVHWHLTFLKFFQLGQVFFPMHLYGHHTFVWEKCWEFQTTSPLKPLGNVAQISCGASLG